MQPIHQLPFYLHPFKTHKSIRKNKSYCSKILQLPFGVLINMQLFFHSSLQLLGPWQLRAVKHGNTVRYVSTIRYASIFAKKYGTRFLWRYGYG